jgi:hypothetical protein
MSVGEADATDPRRTYVCPGIGLRTQVCAQGPPAPDIVGEKTDGSKIGLGQCGGPHSTVGLVARRK